MKIQKTTGSWRPILEKDLKTQAWEAIEAIAKDLKSLGLDKTSTRDVEPQDAGISLFFTYLNLAQPSGEYDAIALELLDQSANAAASDPRQFSLFAGLAGVGWTIEHLRGKLPNCAEEGDPNGGIDAVLNSLVGKTPWEADYDLVSGLVGIGVYALERLPNPSAVDCLRSVIERLGEISEENSDGVTWRTAPELLTPSEREEAPNGYFNAGLAHGVPGVIAILAGASGAGIGGAKTKSLLDGAVSWLLAQKLPEGRGAFFPYWVNPGIQSEPARSGWCYGDPGVIAALFFAAKATKNESWKKQTLTLARAVAERAPELMGVTDASICHGSSALAHIFNRLYQETGESKFCDVASYWLGRTLQYRRMGEKYGGFVFDAGKKDEIQQWKGNPFLLTGSAGIGLALLAGVSEVPPDWDRMLLLSLPAFS